MINCRANPGEPIRSGGTVVLVRTVLPLTLLGWAFTLGLGCTVVDPASLSSFECDDAGRCKVNGKPSEDAGPGTTIDGGRASIDAGTPNCSPATCPGCCDGENRCQTGNLKGLCGQAAVACTACLGATACNDRACVPLKANGSGCSSDDSCASGACVSGLCCSSRCAGTCQSCSLSGTEGLCSLRNEGTGSCGAYACDGLNAECPGSCTSSLQCAPGRFCIGNACQVLTANPAPCTADNQCASGSCSDGVCCDQACTKSCDRCNLAGSVGAYEDALRRALDRLFTGF